ncbi:MAG: amidohydrolase family protein [Acidimicrobiia bacterium]
MKLRAVLRPPGADPITRDVVAGRWVEPAGSADETIGEGMWAIPGLVDAHAHLAADRLFAPGVFADAVARLQEALTAGVMLILDKGWNDFTTVEAIDAVAPEDRPDIEAAARVIAAPDGYMQGFGLRVEPHDLGAAVQAEAKAGRGWVKLIGDWPRKGRGPVANFDESQLRTAVQAAETAGARVAIHTMAREVPSLAVAAGVHSIEHGLFLTEEDLGPLGARGGMWVPTVLRCEATVEQIGAGSSGGRLLSEGLDGLRPLFQEALDAGVHVLAGTDLIGAPADVAAEAIRLADYGLSPTQVLGAVSTSGFAATGRDSGFSIGSPADAVFFPESPLEQLGVLAHPAAVMRRGRLS